MHNLHLVVVKADSPENACNEVETQIMDWGTENNWITICGCISKSGENYEHESGGWSPTSIEEIKKDIIEDVRNGGNFDKETFDNVLSGVKNVNELGWLDWYHIKKYAEHMSDTAQFVSSIKDEDFDIWTASYKDWKLDEFGITNLNYGDGYGDGEYYIVFVDMHS